MKKHLLGYVLLLGLLLSSPLRAFISPDPEGHVASMDLYSYCNGDPVNQYDADGRVATSAGNGFTDSSAGGLGLLGQNNYGNLSTSRNLFGYSIGSTAGSLLGTANGVAGLVLGGGGGAIDQGFHFVGETLGGPVGYQAMQALPFVRLESMGNSLAQQGVAAESSAVGYRAINPAFAESTAQSGQLFRSGAAGRLGNDGIYVNSTAEGAIAEFQYHNPGIDPAVFEVNYPVSPTLNINPPSGYFNQPLPFTQGANILSAPSVRAPGTINLLIREGAVPAGRIQ